MLIVIPDFSDSKTSKVLKQYGVENVLVKAYNHTKVYAHQLERWVRLVKIFFTHRRSHMPQQCSNSSGSIDIREHKFGFPLFV